MLVSWKTCFLPIICGWCPWFVLSLDLCSITPFDKTDLFDLDVKQDRRLVGPGVHIFQLISAGIHFQATTLIESTWANLTFSWEKKNKKRDWKQFWSSRSSPSKNRTGILWRRLCVVCEMKLSRQILFSFSVFLISFFLMKHLLNYWRSFGRIAMESEKLKSAKTSLDNNVTRINRIFNNLQAIKMNHEGQGVPIIAMCQK